jgi:hypothetical protein
MCITLRKDCKLTAMDPETPLADNYESVCLISQLPQELQLLRPVHLKGDLIVTGFPDVPQEDQRWCHSSVVPTNEPASKGIG